MTADGRFKLDHQNPKILPKGSTVVNAAVGASSGTGGRALSGAAATALATMAVAGAGISPRVQPRPDSSSGRATPGVSPRPGSSGFAPPMTKFKVPDKVRAAWADEESALQAEKAVTRLSRLEVEAAMLGSVPPSLSSGAKSPAPPLSAGRR